MKVEQIERLPSANELRTEFTCRTNMDLGGVDPSVSAPFTASLFPLFAQRRLSLPTSPALNEVTPGWRSRPRVFHRPSFLLPDNNLPTQRFQRVGVHVATRQVSLLLCAEPPTPTDRLLAAATTTSAASPKVEALDRGPQFLRLLRGLGTDGPKVLPYFLHTFISLLKEIRLEEKRVQLTGDFGFGPAGVRALAARRL